MMRGNNETGNATSQDPISPSPYSGLYEREVILIQLRGHKIYGLSRHPSQYRHSLLRAVQPYSSHMWGEGKGAISDRRGRCTAKQGNTTCRICRMPVRFDSLHSICMQDTYSLYCRRRCVKIQATLNASNKRSLLDAVIFLEAVLVGFNCLNYILKKIVKLHR